MAKKSFAALILAAGAGTRMKSTLPKVLHRICGKALVEHIIDNLVKCRSDKTVVIVGHQADRVEKALSHKDVSFVLQAEQKGTGHAVQCAKSEFRNFDGDVLILAGDVPLIDANIVKSFRAFHQKKKSQASVLTASIDEPKGYGRIVRDWNNQVLKIVEELDTTAEEKKIQEINSGIYLFDSKLLFEAISNLKVNEKKKEYYLTDIVAYCVSKNIPVEGFEIDDVDSIRGVNSKADLAMLNQILNQRIVSEHLENGVAVLAPDNTYIESDVKIGQDTIIMPFTYIHRDVSIGEDCVIGPFCKIRSQSVISSGVELGSFVEVNRSTIKSGTTVKHLAYLGDAKLGQNVNVGAGTITANYDGKDKHQTVIGDNSFIGSNTVLVAPLKVGNGAKTGAGSVVKANTKIPSGSTLVGVPARVLSKKN